MYISTGSGTASLERRASLVIVSRINLYLASLQKFAACAVVVEKYLPNGGWLKLDGWKSVINFAMVDTDRHKLS